MTEHDRVSKGDGDQSTDARHGTVPRAPEKPVYLIRNWAEHFEKSDVKKTKRCLWVAVPNKHDGKSFRRLLRMPRGMEMFGAWNLILQVASKMPARGRLADEDGPLDAEDLSDMTGGTVELFDITLKTLCDKQIGWMDADSSGCIRMASGYIPTTGMVGQDKTGQGGQGPPPRTGSDSGGTSFADAVDDAFVASAGRRPSSEPPPDPALADARREACNAFGRWSEKAPPVGRRKPLVEFANEFREVHALVAELAQKSPVIEGGRQIARHLLVPRAVDALAARGRPFKSPKFAVGCVRNELEDWANAGPGNGAGRSPPRPVHHGNMTVKT